MHDDIFGQPTSLTSAVARSEWDAAQKGFLAHAAATPSHLAATLGAEPDFAMGHAVKGLFTLLMGRRELDQTAAEALAAARRLSDVGGATARERLYVQALAAYLGGRPSGAVVALERVLDAHPGDALAAKLSHSIRFVLGDAAGMRASVERVLPALALDHPARGYLLGCHAFALEETGAYRRAEIAGRQALWTAPDDAWGLHAVAHVHDMTGRSRAGIDWLAGREAAWAHCNNFRYHVWWHRALLHLDLGEIDTVIDLYDAEIRADRTDDYRDISNAASLLMRLDLDGVDVGARWEELAAISERRTEDGCLIFADLHYALALVGGGRDVALGRLMARIARDAGRRATESDGRMAEPGLAAAAGLAAFGAGDHATAFRHLRAARGTMQRAGGSHAQRDVFERMTIDAGLRAGFLDAAAALLDERARRRGGTEDGYAAARRAMIGESRRAMSAGAVPAE